MIYTALGVKFNIFRFFPGVIENGIGIFLFPDISKRFFGVRLVNSSLICYNKREQTFVTVKNICLILGVGVWKERIYAVI